MTTTGLVCSYASPSVSDASSPCSIARMAPSSGSSRHPTSPTNWASELAGAPPQVEHSVVERLAARRGALAVGGREVRLVVRVRVVDAEEAKPGPQLLVDDSLQLERVEAVAGAGVARWGSDAGRRGLLGGRGEQRRVPTPAPVVRSNAWRWTIGYRNRWVQTAMTSITRSRTSAPPACS